MTDIEPEVRQNDAREEHELLQPIFFEGAEKQAGDKVPLWPDQVERLRESGHIQGA